MDNDNFIPGRDRTANPARARFLGSSGMTPYMEDRTRRIYKALLLEMCGEEPDDESRHIAIQHTTDILNSTPRGSKAGGGTLMTTEQVARVVERLRLPDTVTKDAPVQLSAEAFSLVADEAAESGDTKKAVASRLILAGYAAMMQGTYGDTEGFSPH